jgi:hypothetical protein
MLSIGFARFWVFCFSIKILLKIKMVEDHEHCHEPVELRGSSGYLGGVVH